MVTLIAGQPCAVAARRVPSRWLVRACGGRMVIPQEGTWPDLESFASIADLVRCLYVFQGDLLPTSMEAFYNLTRLVIQPGVGGFTLDLAVLPSLAELSLCRNATLAVPAQCQLEELDLERPDREVLEVLPRLSALKRLKIYGAFPSELPASLRALDIAGARAPEQLTPLPLLRELQLSRITGISDLRLFAGSRDLARVIIEDVPTFASIDPFDDTALETLLLGDVLMRHSR